MQQDFIERMVAFRRDLHRHPELSYQEKRTAEQIRKALEKLGISHRTGIAETGIIAEIPAAGGALEGPRIALRADMDALPIREETGLPFASVHEGVMHACGHDGHTAMVLGAAELLSREKDLPAPVRVLFQPAEERGSGAVAMIEGGALEDVAMIFGGHVDRHYPTGQIVTHAGAVNASTDSFRLEIQGKGGHAARPHEGVDAVVVGSLLVTAIQTIVSREINPAHPSVITVGRFDAGTAPNVLAGRAVLEGTLRAQEKSVRDHLVSSLTRVCEAVGNLHNAKISVTIEEGTPPVVNPKDMAEIARKAAGLVVGEDNAVSLHTPNMGGEDFAYYMEKIPGCYVRLGARAARDERGPAHSSQFDFDENVLPIGAQFFFEVARIAGQSLRARD
ncbi:MAG: M20 metallopeptidase family protein [Vicinamibacteria bacterium]